MLHLIRLFLFHDRFPNSAFESNAFGVNEYEDGMRNSFHFGSFVVFVFKLIQSIQSGHPQTAIHAFSSAFKLSRAYVFSVFYSFRSFTQYFLFEFSQQLFLFFFSVRIFFLFCSPISSKIAISGIPLHAHFDDIEPLLKAYGRVEHCDAVSSKDPNTQTVHITYETVEQAQRY